MKGKEGEWTNYVNNLVEGEFGQLLRTKDVQGSVAGHPGGL